MLKLSSIGVCILDLFFFFTLFYYNTKKKSFFLIIYIQIDIIDFVIISKG